MTARITEPGKAPDVSVIVPGRAHAHRLAVDAREPVRQSRLKYRLRACPYPGACSANLVRRPKNDGTAEP